MSDQAMSAVGFASPSAAAGAFIECIDWFGVRTNVCTLTFRFQSFCSNRGAMKNLATASGGYPLRPQLWSMLNWPSSYHLKAGGLSFADCHSEIKRWRDPRTTAQLSGR